MQFIEESKEEVLERFAQTIVLANANQLDHCSSRCMFYAATTNSPLRMFAIRWIMKVSCLLLLNRTVIMYLMKFIIVLL